MTTNIDNLIAEAREWASGSPLGKITAREVDKGILFARRLADALEDVYRASLTGQAEHARWQERAEKAEAERDRYLSALNRIDMALRGDERSSMLVVTAQQIINEVLDEGETK